MNKLMCAKFVVAAVVALTGAGSETVTAETITFRAVCKEDGYDETGKDENNNFALWTPAADLTMTINNPALFGKYKEGDEVYVHFSTPGNVELEPEPEALTPEAPPIPLPDVAQGEQAPPEGEQPSEEAPPSGNPPEAPVCGETHGRLKVGRIVNYTVSDAVASIIADQRARSDGRLQGNALKEGDVVPLVVCRVWDEASGMINGQLLLDGNDSHWATSVPRSDEPKPGHWHWPSRE